MAKKNIVILIALFCLLGSGLFLAPLQAPQPIFVSMESDLSSLEDNTSKIRSSAMSYTNVTAISDDATLWNTGISVASDIAIDNDGNIYVVWRDYTDGPWNVGDPDKSEIMYKNFTAATKQWSNITVLSDGWNGVWGWNTELSSNPAIAVNKTNGNIYVVWEEETDGPWGIDREIMCVNFTTATGQWSNVTVLSDGWGGVWGWNDGSSQSPDIVVDNSGNIHVVWKDNTDGPWGGDTEIMYVNFTVATGQWSNATVISDKWADGTPWNTGSSSEPAIAVDKNNNIYVVWSDSTAGPWNGDIEIMCANFSVTTGQWSNATVISDKWADGTPWNDGSSEQSAITVDGANNVHVVWTDLTNGPWADPGDNSPEEILYTKYSVATGEWSNATAISDKWADGTPWNDEESSNPAIAAEGSNIHVVWQDDTGGPWGSGGSGNYEIMYAKSSNNGGSWSNATVISDKWADGTEWNTDFSELPAIAAESLKVHVVWQDHTDGPWGNDEEIFYCTITETAAGGYLTPGDDDDDDDDDDEADLLVPIVVVVVLISAVGGIALVYIFMKKRKR